MSEMLQWAALDAYTFTCLTLPIVALLIALNSYQYIGRRQESRDRIRAKLDLYAMAMKLIFVMITAISVLVSIHEAGERQYDQIRGDAIAHMLFILNSHYRRADELGKISRNDKNLLKSCITSAQEEARLGSIGKGRSMF